MYLLFHITNRVTGCDFLLLVEVFLQTTFGRLLRFIPPSNQEPMWNPKSIRNVLALSKSRVFNSADVMDFWHIGKNWPLDDSSPYKILVEKKVEHNNILQRREIKLHVFVCLLYGLRWWVLSNAGTYLRSFINIKPGKRKQETYYWSSQLLFAELSRK